jgi:hypothetical protein
MIRRDSLTSSAEAEWILISQGEHARAAGALAEHWGAGRFAPLEPRSELLWAIVHHDDGWSGWDAAPDVNLHGGQPRSFTEMELSDSLAIWCASIETARRAGPLEAYLVAGHFCALARRVSEWMKDEVCKHQAGQFIEEHETLMVAWLAAWQFDDPAANTRKLAELALSQLQFFDALSLWFCCSEASETEEAQTPVGPVLSLCPLDPRHVALTPWPFKVASLNLEVRGRAVPAAPYRDRADLAATPSKPVVLRWQLQPGCPKV